jgi:hypothetical protein
LVELGYTTSVNRFCWDAVDEKVTRTLKDYETLGKILSDKLKSEFGHENGGTIDYKRASHDEFILRKSDYFPKDEVKECLKW